LARCDVSLCSAHEANGFPNFRNVTPPQRGRRRLLARSGAAEAIERRMETAKIEAEPRKPFPGLAAWPSKSNVCVCPKGGKGKRMQGKTIRKSREAISRKLASLRSLPIKELKQQWRSFYSSEPPHRVSRELLTRAVAYRIQEQALEGLKPSTRRLLERLACDARSGRPLKLSPCAPASAGTVLMRDWQGITHEVKVLDRGVLYKRKRYRSLSEVARLITGSRWSGPLFFGLRSKRQEDTSRGSK
jgi:DUF2924 family protein